MGAHLNGAPSLALVDQERAAQEPQPAELLGSAGQKSGPLLERPALGIERQPALSNHARPRGSTEVLPALDVLEESVMRLSVHTPTMPPRDPMSKGG